MTNNTEFTHLLNLADARLGSIATFVTDDWFADVNRMLQPQPPVWKEGVFDDNGKWMDGWESRRKRYEGYDHAIIKLGVAGVFKGVDIDTTFFTGNYPPSASLEACYSPEAEPDDSTQWTQVLAPVNLQGDSNNLFDIDSDQPWTHVRFNIFPDGGVARLRIYGTPFVDWSQNLDQTYDFASALLGARSLACSDEHYGKMSNILNPGRGINMGDGWETARRRVPGNDWVIIQLAKPCLPKEIIVDTHFFKGNYPDSCSIQAALVESATDEQVATRSLYWRELLPAQKLQMDREHTFNSELNDLGVVSHIKLNIFPDGGISRIRVIGKLPA
ncbi:allantoicase [Neptunomonas phycophila]|uniref:Probable allantoicase n=1 Tax=Neptunomonas phycophila TaxID=1572645 RepID=A0ABT9EPZ3_9GAMM|nr:MULTISPECIES: allantoicase [Neptunomonas]MDN2659619.1 allantoicase [Neptunomonas sp. CHC150]MDP2521130.1 allantoicase [Neptunomonas phycophila]